MLGEGLSQALAAEATITSLVGAKNARADGTSGIFPGQLPEGCTLPAIAYSDIAGDGLMTMDGPDPLQTARVSFSCDGKSHAAAKRLARTVRQFFENFTGILPDGTPIGSMRRVSEIDIFEFAPFTYRTVVDIEIVYQDVTREQREPFTKEKTMSQAFAPRGTQFEHSPDGVTYTTVAEVSKIQNTGSKADLADVTNMDSASSFREFLATLVDSGEIALDMNFIPGNATQQILETDFNGQVNGYYKVVLPNALGNATFRAFVSSKDFDLPIDKQGTRSVKLKVTGQITVTW